MGLPTSGVISLDDIGVEYGYAPGTFLNFNTMWGELGEGTDPDSLNEAYGWDRDWFDVGNGWLNITGINLIDAGSNWYLQIGIDNDSQAHAYTETLYWRLYEFGVGGSLRYSDNLSTGSRSAGSSGTLNDNTVNKTYTPDAATVSFDGSNWIEVPLTGP